MEHNYSNIGIRLSLIEDHLSRISSPPNRVILTTKEVQKLLGICSKTLQKLRDEGKLAFCPVSKKLILYKLSDILDMLDKHKVEAL